MIHRVSSSSMISLGSGVSPKVETRRVRSTVSRIFLWKVAETDRMMRSLFSSCMAEMELRRMKKASRRRNRLRVRSVPVSLSGDRDFFCVRSGTNDKVVFFWVSVGGSIGGVLLILSKFCGERNKILWFIWFFSAISVLNCGEMR